MTLGEDLKNFRAEERGMSRLAATLAIVAIVMLTVTAHTITYHADVASAKAREEFVPMWKRFPMPPAAPIFESPAELMRLSPPVPCVRLDGEHRGMGQEWIRAWGDGEAPPITPTCVRARQPSPDRGDA